MPLADRPLIVIACLGYFLLVLAIGLFAARRTRSQKDFYIAGQRIGLITTGLATTATAFSGFLFVGGPGLTYRIGVASLMIVVPIGFTSTMLCFVLARRLRFLAGAREVFTIPDALAVRFASRGVGGLAAVAVLVGTVGYLGSQLLALGVILNAVFDLTGAFGSAGVPLAVATGALVILAYSASGGMVAGVYTDLLQGALMVAASTVVFSWAWGVGGGPTGIAQAIAGAQEFGPAFLDPFGRVPMLTAFGFFLVFGVGTLGQPQLVHKFFMLDDPRKIRWLPAVIGGSQALCVLIWIGIGLAVPALVARGALAPLTNPDDATPVFLLSQTPEAVAGIVLAGAMAAIMSTADTFANIGAGALVRDIPRALGRRPRRGLLLARLATVAITLSAAILALVYDDLVALLGTFAFGTFAAALAPALAVGLCWERVTARAAGASIATGLVVNLSLEALRGAHRFGAAEWIPASPLANGALPSAAALAASFLVLIAISAWDRTGRPLEEGLRELLEE